MKTLTVIFALATVIFAAPAAAEDNPFGLDLDKHPTEYGCSQMQGNKYHYVCETVPKPHPEFKGYGIQYVEGVGVCSMSAIGKTIENASYGFTIKERVDVIAKQIRQKYGVETEKLDDILPISIWDDPDDWMMAVLKGERLYIYSWVADEGFKPVGEVVKIFVAATAVASDAGYVRVEFHFKRDPQCEAIIEKAGQDVF